MLSSSPDRTMKQHRVVAVKYPDSPQTIKNNVRSLILLHILEIYIKMLFSKK